MFCEDESVFGGFDDTSRPSGVSSGKHRLLRGVRNAYSCDDVMASELAQQRLIGIGLG